MGFVAGEARAERCQIRFFDDGIHFFDDQIHFFDDDIRFFDDDIHFFDDVIHVVAGAGKVEMMLEIFLRNRYRVFFFLHWYPPKK